MIDEQDKKIIEKMDAKIASKKKSSNTRGKNNTGYYGYKKIKDRKGFYTLYQFYRFPKQQYETSAHEESVVDIDKYGHVNKQASRELDAKINAYIKQRKSQSVNCNSSFVDYCRSWLKNVAKLKVSPGVYDNYETIIKHQLEPYIISKRKCSELKGYMIEDYLQELARDYSKGTVDKAYNDVIKPTIRYGMKREDIGYIDLEDIAKPKKYKTGKRIVPILDKEQFKQIYHELDNHGTNDSRLIIFIMFTGLRIEEVCSLKWKDVDKDFNWFQVQRSTQDSKKRDKNGEIIKNKAGHAIHIKTEKDPKTEKSNRKIPTNTIAKKQLQKLANAAHTDKDYVFCNGNGNKYDRNNVRRTLGRISRRLNIEITLHGLRHTVTSLLINDPRVSNKAVQELLGHKDIKTTMNVYAESYDEDMQNAVNVLDELV